MPTRYTYRIHQSVHTHPPVPQPSARRAMHIRWPSRALTRRARGRSYICRGRPCLILLAAISMLIASLRTMPTVICWLWLVRDEGDLPAARVLSASRRSYADTLHLPDTTRLALA